MCDAETLYHQIADALSGNKKSKLFGCQCVKALNGKAAFFYWPKAESAVFKLQGDAAQEALALDGAHYFQPKSERPPMNGWVQLSFDYADRWPAYAALALAYVQTLR